MAYDTMEMDDDQEGEATQGKIPVELLQSFVGVSNIVDMLNKEQVQKIGMEVTRGYDLDKASRADWEKQSQTAMDLAMQVSTEKSWPWPKAANVKYPLITTAAIQFSARAYPAIVRGSEVVKGQVMGPDPDGRKKERADRIGHHMSYQVLEEIKDWDEDEDKLLLQMSIVGCAFRKTYFDTMLGRPCSDLVAAKYVVYNHATPFNKLRRITHCLNLFKNEVIERQRGGIFEEDLTLGLPSGEDNDEDGHFEFLEQHCWYDLDGDGYKEPYIVTVLKETSEVARIIASFDEDGIFMNAKGEVSKIVPVEYFTKFAFIPAPDGGFYDVGFGQMIGPLSASVDTTINQLLDAGTLSNNSSGFKRKGTKIGQKSGGSVQFSMGEFKDIDIPAGVSIDQSIYQMQFPGPSPVLFNLLGMLIQAAKDITGIQDVMTGGQQQNETATTTMARIEQGLKVFSAIYKRVYRGFNEEFQKLYKLNAQYLNPEVYFRVLDDNSQGRVMRRDFNVKEADIRPVSDPSLGTTMQKMAKADLLMKVMADPRLNGVEIYKRFFDAAEIEGFERLVLPPEKWPQPPPDTSELEMELKSLQLRDQSMKLYADTVATYAKALESMASAESKEVGPQYGLYRAQLSELTRMIGEANANQGRGASVEAGPGNGGGAEGPEGLGAGGNVGPDRGVELPGPQLSGDSVPIGGMQG